MAIVVAFLFGVVLHNVTGLHLTGSCFDIDEVTGEKYITLKNLILPAFTLGIRPLAIITQLTRSSMLDVLGQDYIRTAYAKGLNSTTVIYKHALRNALNPVITAITGWFAELLAGAFFVEYIFGWKGIGKITVDALEKLDYPVVMGSVLLSACIFITINLLADVLYGIVDPRVR
jgi:peptide/nickel transport system permease protein